MCPKSSKSSHPDTRAGSPPAFFCVWMTGLESISTYPHPFDRPKDGEQFGDSNRLLGRPGIIREKLKTTDGSRKAVGCRLAVFIPILQDG